MPGRDFEIIQSGEYWQSLRRAKIAREARQGQPAPATNPVLASSDRIYTFIPGCAEPITSVMHTDGSVVPISSLPVASSSTSRRPTPTRRMPISASNPLRGTNSMAYVAAARAAADDALLLARLTESPDARRKRKIKEELAQARRAAKKQIENLAYLMEK
ncbi:hypothetical protein C8F04DRAFT_1178196 [Mycena alexandri]|uniref:Uncharacterized protein n=1 Tax=Mycena alexandri TaxID=1745969 RepID=A0AAD6TA16_9AGAR|nr:hypothetical protein C8F04DRAFT_1178196 [Mycena alexandri]